MLGAAVGALQDGRHQGASLSSARALRLTRTSASSACGPGPSRSLLGAASTPAPEVGGDAGDHERGRRRSAPRCRVAGPFSPASTDRRTPRSSPRRRRRGRSPVARARPKVGGIEGVVPDLAVDELVHRARRGGGELVEAVVAVEHQHVLGAELAERAEHRRRHRRIRDADRLAAHARRVGERTEEVERRGDTRARGAPGRGTASPGGSGARSRSRRRPTRRTRATPIGPSSIATPSASSTSAEPQRDDAARLPCFTTRAPAPAAISAAIVETFTVPERSPPVPHVSIAPSATSHLGAVGTHRAHERGELARGLALRPQRDDEARRLHVGDPAFEDLAECRPRLRRAQRRRAASSRARIGVRTSFTARLSPTRDRGRAHRARSARAGSATCPRRS